MKKIVMAVVLSVALVVPSVASAKIVKQEGQIVGDNATEVKLRVKVTGGEAKRVAGFRAKNVRTRCDDGPTRITFKALDPVDVNDRNRFRVRLSDGEGGFLRIAGKVRNRGRATVGTLKTNRFTHPDENQMCRTPKQRFKTSKS